MKSFALDLRAFAEKAGKNADLVARKVGIDAAAQLIDMTPVDTGRARANWTVAVGAPWGDVRDATDKSGQATKSAATAALAAYRCGPSIWITNNLPYIERLENGWSRKAPAGMLGVTAMRLESFVSRATREVAK